MIVVIGGTQEEAEYHCKRASPDGEIIAMGVLPSCTRLNGLAPDDVYFVGAAESNSYFREACVLAKHVWQKFHEPIAAMCGHCSAIFEPEIGLRPSGLMGRKLAYLYRHICPDGHIEDKFESVLPITDEDMEAFAEIARKVLKDTR